MSVTLNGPLLMATAFLPLMHGHGWAESSRHLGNRAIAGPVSIAHLASKMGVIGFTRACRHGCY